MKHNKHARSVTLEMFFVYFLGYIAISLILLIVISLSFKFYELACSRRTYNRQYFENLERKIELDYSTITDDDLKEIDGFLIKINNDGVVEYSSGNFDTVKFNNFKLEDYMSMVGFNEENKFKVNHPDILSKNIFKNFNNVLVTLNNGDKYSIYTQYRSKDKFLILIGCPYSEITKPNKVTQIIPYNYVIKLLAFGNVMVIFGMVYILAQKTSKEFITPIKTLLSGVTEISNGNYDVRIKCEKINEFLELSNGFNNMAQTIQNEQYENRKLEKMREDLILDISHDLKNPLASTLGYSETLINSDNLSKEQIREYLTIINRNSYRANKLINDLFEFSLYDNVDYEFNLVKKDICEVLRQIIANFIPEFDHKNFIYDFDIFDESYYVLMDEEKFYRAINNILDNKVKYNKSGNKIFIKTETDDINFYIKFCDNGERIPEEFKDSIFNPFVRVDKSRNSKTGGTGLGLSIVKHILELHKFEYGVVTKENKGTTFLPWRRRGNFKIFKKVIKSFFGTGSNTLYHIIYVLRTWKFIAARMKNIHTT